MFRRKSRKPESKINYLANKVAVDSDLIVHIQLAVILGVAGGLQGRSGEEFLNECLRSSGVEAEMKAAMENRADFMDDILLLDSYIRLAVLIGIGCGISGVPLTEDGIKIEPTSIFARVCIDRTDWMIIPGSEKYDVLEDRALHAVNAMTGVRF